MGLYHSPKVATDGLVFMYDTGNSKSYVGEPTENVKPTGVAVGHAPGSYGNDVEVTDAPEKGAGWKKVTIKDRGSNKRIIQWTYTSMAADTMYCHSAVFDWGNMRGKGYYINHDGNGTGTRNFYLPNDYSSSQGSSLSISSSLPDGKIAGTITHTASHNHAFFINNSTTGLSGLNDYFYYKEFQVEVNTHPTQYTSGTRSNTQGLIDRTNNATITLSNLSYDSNAQMSFDGTDDYFQISDPNVSSADGFSIEIVTKPENISSAPVIITPNSEGIDHFARFNSNGSVYFRMVVAADSTTQDFATTTQLTDSNYHHLVFTFRQSEGGKVYYNGELESSAAANFTAKDWSSIWRIGQRGNSTWYYQGELPIIKVYNQVLTSTDVTKNFNAIRSRFGL